MQKPLELTFRHMDSSPAMTDAIRERVENLERFSDNIVGCSVVVEAPHKHHRKGNLFHLRIDVTVPGKEIVVKRSADENHAHEDPYVALRDAFDAVRRQLEDYAREQRGKVKHHEDAPHARVTELWPEMDYGRMLTPDGRDIYFHRNSIVNGSFDDLEIGAELRFDEEAGDEGPQASSAYIVGKA